MNLKQRGQSNINHSGGYSNFKFNFSTYVSANAWWYEMGILVDQFEQSSSICYKQVVQCLFHSGLNSYLLLTISPANSSSSYSLFLREHIQELHAVRLLLQLNSFAVSLIL